MANSSIESRLQRLEDKQAIIELRNSYSYFSNVDGRPSAERWKSFVANFVEDGEFHAGFSVMRGRQAILEGCAAAGSYFARFMHLTTNGAIDISEDAATGTWCGLFPFMKLDDPKLLWGCNVYHDEYIRTSEGWKFKSVRSAPVFFAKEWHDAFPAFAESNPGCFVAEM